MEYIFAQGSDKDVSNSSTQCAFAVNALLSTGWTLYGNPTTVVMQDGTLVVTQALTK